LASSRILLVLALEVLFDRRPAADLETNGDASSAT
jgi:hypothetical protein